jgi:poly(3-hydroxybutyrate) depolymerase
MKRTKDYLLLLLLLFVAICSKSQSYPYCISGRFAENDLFNSLAIISHSNVVYGQNLNYLVGMDTLKMDIFHVNPLIDNLSKKPVVIFFHGGDFSSGSKTDVNAYCEQLARRGFVAASVQYRLGWNNNPGGNSCDGDFSTYRYASYRALQDANAAIRFLTVNASMYSIDTSYIFIAGQDAGAITAMNAGFVDQNEANILYPGALADLGGIYNSGNNLIATYTIKGILNWCGGIADTNCIDANENIPVLSIHGLKDSIMPVSVGPYKYCNSTLNPAPVFYGPKQLFQRMKNIGICAESNYDANGEHCFFPTLEPVNYVPFKFTCFFKNILCGNCNTNEKVSYSIQSCMDAAPLTASSILGGNQLTISPIPVHSQCTIDGFINEEATIQIRLISLLGQQWIVGDELRNKSGQLHQTFSLPKGIVNGIYILQLQLNDEIINRKIVIE